MQTFVPFGSNFKENARVLDRQRLGKQRVEGLQILNTLTGRNSGWVNHPIVKMWKGYETALVFYVLDICKEWTDRGYKDTCAGKAFSMIPEFTGAVTIPGWLDDPEVQLSHRSNLVRKFPEHYRQYFPDVADDLPYKWVL